MATCPHCKEQIEESAIKCPQCGSWVKGLRNLIELVRPIVELFALIAAVAVLILMYCQNTLMKDELKLSKNQYEDSRIALIEQNRPRIQIESQTVTKTDSSLIIVNTSITNYGSSDAEKVLVYTTHKLPSTDKDTSSSIIKLDKVPMRSQKIIPDNIVILGPSYDKDFYSLVVVRYSWSLGKEPYEDHVYYIHRYRKKVDKYITYQLNEEDGKQAIRTGVIP